MLTTTRSRETQGKCPACVILWIWTAPPLLRDACCSCLRPLKRSNGAGVGSYTRRHETPGTRRGVTHPNAAPGLGEE
jgi:hypothetical protein